MQIKLSAWDEETKIYYRELFNQGLTIMCIYGNKIFILREYADHIQELQPLLFTGKLDVNGQEVYHGDIIKAWIGDEYRICEVVFDDGCFALKVSDEYYPCLAEIHSDYIGVIGNKFEQPELLEGNHDKT